MIFGKNKISIKNNGDSISIVGNGNICVTQRNGQVFVNGNEIDGIDNEKQINIVIDGNVDGDLSLDCGNITVNGSVEKNVKTISGDIDCGAVKGNATTVSGDISAMSIHGDCTTVSGDISK